MTKKAKTAAERNHHERIAAMSCVVCDALEIPQEQPTTVHHIREGQGIAQRSSHWLAVPLCHFCHQGGPGAHGDRSLLRLAKMTELDLLAETIKRLSAEGAL